MEGVNIKFTRLQEDLEDLQVDSVSRRREGESRARKFVSQCSWRSVLVVLCMFSLLLIISYNRHDINYKYVTLMSKFNISDRVQHSYIADLQKVSTKINLAMRNLTRLENAHDDILESRPWILDINEAKGNLKDEIKTLKTRLNEVERKFRDFNTTVDTIRVRVGESENELRGNKDKVELVTSSIREVEARLDAMNTLIHRRIDTVVNSSRDMSVAHQDQQENLFEMISDLEYKQEVMEDDGEETQLATDLSLERLETEISKLEAALNMTVSHWAELKTGHTEFAKKTLTILSNMMELAHTQSTTQPTQNTIDSIEARQQDESSTTSPVKYSNCTNVVKFPPSEISCEASSEFHKRFSCQKAFDGHLSVGKKKNSWASRGEGRGAWIKATFNGTKSISQLKLLQRHFPGEANKKVEIEFSPAVKQLATLPARGDRHWNIIKLSRNVRADYVKITVKEVYGKINNGFKEIEIYGCDYITI